MFLKTRAVEIDGGMVGIIGLDEIFSLARDFDTAFEKVKQRNYIPEEAEDKYRKALKKEFERTTRQ
jgi:hypothetical protein